MIDELVRRATPSAHGRRHLGKQNSIRFGRRSAIFVDEAAQAFTSGECQHAFAAGLIARQRRASLGRRIAGLGEGRRDGDEITLFDGTGVSLQDLVVADLAVQRATEQGLGVTAEY